MVSLHDEFRSWDLSERYDSVAAIDSRFVPLFPRNLFIRRTAWFMLCTRIRGFAGVDGKAVIRRRNEDGGGEKCEIKESAGRCMTMGGEDERDGGAGH